MNFCGGSNSPRNHGNPLNCSHNLLCDWFSYVVFLGKTLLAKAVANQTSATFLRVVGSELIQKYLVSDAYTWCIILLGNNSGYGIHTHADEQLCSEAGKVTVGRPESNVTYFRVCDFVTCSLSS